MNIDNLRVKPTLERQTYGYAMRQALRRERAFYTKDHRVFVLVVPDGSLFEYQLAATLMIQSMELQNRYDIVTPDVTRKGGVEFAPVRLALEKTKSVLILVESRMKLPRFVVAAANSVREVGPLKPYHVAAAAKSIHKISMTKEEAIALLEYPMLEMFAAIRPDRSIQYSLERLAAAHAAGIATATPGQDVVRLEQLSGYGDAKRWGLDLADDLNQWKLGKLAWKDVDAGVLLSGPPGTGKTLFASALAETCRVSFVATSAAQWQSTGHLGDMLAAMRKSFQDADAKRPCILLIDEIDSVGDRGKFSGHNQQYMTEVVNALLECMDGSERREGVVVVGATNHAGSIDPALRRSGRLDSHFRLELPDYESRKGIISMQFDGMLSDEEAGRIAEVTEGYSGADFVKLARDARRKARKASARMSADHIVAVLPAAIPLQGADRHRVAVHEVGHAVIGSLTGFAKLLRVELSREMRSAGMMIGGITHFERRAGELRTNGSYLAEIAMNLGGMAAEDVVFGSISDGAGGSEGSDIQAATDIATVMEAQLGMGEGISHFMGTTSKELEKLRSSNQIISTRVEKVVLAQLQQVKRLLSEHRRALEALAEALEKAGSLSGEEVARMLAAGGSAAKDESAHHG